MDYFSSSATVPATEVGVAPVPVTLLSHPEACFVPLQVLSSWTGLGRHGPGLAMVCVILELPERQNTYSKHFVSFSGFCTCSSMKLQSTGWAYCPMYLPIPSLMPYHFQLSNLGPDLYVVFLKSKTWNTFRGQSNRSMLICTSKDIQGVQRYSEFSRIIGNSMMDEKGKMKGDIFPID